MLSSRACRCRQSSVSPFWRYDEDSDDLRWLGPAVPSSRKSRRRWVDVIDRKMVELRQLNKEDQDAKNKKRDLTIRKKKDQRS